MSPARLCPAVTPWLHSPWPIATEYLAVKRLLCLASSPEVDEGAPGRARPIFLLGKGVFHSNWDSANRAGRGDGKVAADLADSFFRLPARGNLEATEQRWVFGVPKNGFVG